MTPIGVLSDTDDQAREIRRIHHIRGNKPRPIEGTLPSQLRRVRPGFDDQNRQRRKYRDANDDFAMSTRFSSFTDNARRSKTREPGDEEQNAVAVQGAGKLHHHPPFRRRSPLPLSTIGRNPTLVPERTDVPSRAAARVGESTVR